MDTYRPLYRTSRPNRASDVPRFERGKRPKLRANRFRDLRNTVALSYSYRSGRSGPALTPARRLRPRGVCSGRAGQGAAMTDLLELVALSRLSPHCWRRAAESLRVGDAPPDVLQRLAGALWPGDPGRLARLRAEAAESLARAERDAIAAIAWSDPAYPVALATIVDPPPVVWTRGRIDALHAP